MEKKGWIKRVLVYAAPFKGKIAAAVLLYMAQTLCVLFMPYVMSNIVNVGVAGSDMDYIFAMSGVMAGMTILSLLCAVLTNKLVSTVVPQFAGAIQKGIFKKTNSLSFEEFGKVGAGSLLTRSTEDVMFFTDMTGQIIYALSTFPVMFIGGVVLALGCDPLLSLILLLAAPIILFIVRLISRRMHALWKKSDEYCDIQNSVVRERLTGLRVIRAFDKEDYEHERISKATHVMARYIISANVRAGTLNPISVMLLNVATVIMLYVASHRIQTQSLLTAGDVMAVIQYVTLIMNGIITMSWSFVMLPQIRVRGGRIAEVLALEGIPEGDDTGLRLEGSLELDHVTFGYEGSEEPVLKDINMSIKSGEIVGIIGGTGSGKTTVTKLLLHFYKPTSGSVSLGGKSYEELSRETTRGNLSIALQKGMIFGATVGENVKMGNKDASDDEVREALDIAQMTEFVASHEEGLDYKLLQSGSNISGGQKQRINIARTVIKKASVYIFDDSFSALDYLTESKLRAKLNEKLKGKTQIIITQRAATAMKCDKVYVMDRGMIVGSGTHEELLKNCPIYKEIYDSQLGGDALVKEVV